MRSHFIKKVELMLEFRIDPWIRLVAAGGHIKIMQGDLIFQLCALAEHNRNMTAIGLAAETLDIDLLKRHAREHSDTVIALLPIERRLLVPEPLETLDRKGIIRTLGFLQAQHIRPRAFQKFCD